MTKYVILLRAVNVGGRGKVAMADLARCLTGAGMADVRTVLQSGNAVGTWAGGGRGGGAAALAAAIEERLAADAGVASDVIVRTAAEWAQIVAANPFAAEAKADPSHLLVLVSKAALKPAAVEALAARAAELGPERVAAAAGCAFAYYPTGMGRSRLTTAVIERVLGVRVTGRNWNTVTKLAGMVAG